MEPTTAPDPVGIRAQLEKILSSALFLRAPLAQRFLRYVVDAELAGESADIKEYRLGVDVFDRGADFDPKADTVVRVEGVRLRKRLADYYAAEGAADPIVIDIPKGSYRAAFRRQPTGPPATAVEPSPPVHHPQRAWIASAFLVVGGLFAAYLLLRDREPFCSWIHDRPCLMNIAVLPFKVIGGDPRDSALAEGLLYVLAGKLSALEGRQVLSVVPAPDVVASGASASSEARSRLGVNLVFTGSVERGTAGIRVTLSLTDAHSQRQLRAQKLDVPSTEPASLQDAVLAAAVELLDIELNPRVQTVLAAGAPVVPSAQDYYLQSRGYIERGPTGADDAMLLLNEALGRDPNYALAHAAMAEALLLKYQAEKDRRWIDRGLESAQTARRLGPTQAEVWIVSGVLLRETGQGEKALSEFRQAITLDPRSWRALKELAATLEDTGRAAEAERMYRKAVELRPETWSVHVEMGNFLFRKGLYAEAEASFRRAAALAPENPMALTGLGSAVMYEGRPAEAIPWLRKSLLLQPRVDVYVALAEAHEALSQYREMVPLLVKAVDLAPKALLPLYSLGRAYRLTGSPENARAAFERAESLLRDFLAVNPTIRGVRALHAMTLAELDRCGEALTEGERSAAEPPPGAYVLRRAVFVFEKCGRHDRAIAVLRALAHQPEELALARRDPDLASLRADPVSRTLLGH